MSPDSYGEPSNGPSESKRFRRTRSGCLTCRSRRVKCDESKPVCGNCRKLRTTCAWTDDRTSPTEDQTSNPDSTIRRRRRPRRRLPTCIPCHVAKARCSHTPPICERCLVNRQVCTWSEQSDAVTPATPARSEPQELRRLAVHDVIPTIDPSSLASPVEPTIPVDSLPSLQLGTLLAPGSSVQTLVNAFFTHVHPTQAMGFLHQGQLLRDIKEGSASPMLIRAICSVSFRFLEMADRGHPDGGHLAAKWADEVKVWLVQDNNQVSLSKLAAVLCIIHHESNSGRLLSAWMWIAHATRMALAMGLDSSQFMAKSPAYSQCPWVTQETARRLMWATVSVDALGSSAHDKYKLVHTDVDIALPVNEHLYRMGQCPETAGKTLKDLQQGAGLAHPTDGFMSRWVRLMLLRRSVLCYACYGHKEVLPPWTPGSTFDKLEQRLADWDASMPADMGFTLDNLYIRHSSDDMASLTGLHLLFDLVRISLFRIGCPKSSFNKSEDTIYPNMPDEFAQACRHKAYQVGLGIQDRLRLIEDHFPAYVSSSRLWIRSVHASLRVQIEHLNAQQEDLVDTEPGILLGFKTMLATVAKMTRYFSAERKTVRDLLDMLAQNGYSLYTEVDDAAVATRCGTPSIPHIPTNATGDGAILSDIPWVRRSIKARNITDVGMGSKTESIDTASNPFSATLDQGNHRVDPFYTTPVDGPFPLSGFSNEVLEPSVADQDSVFSLWTHFQPEPPQPTVQDLESMFGLPQDWSERFM